MMIFIQEKKKLETHYNAKLFSTEKNSDLKKKTKQKLVSERKEKKRRKEEKKRKTYLGNHGNCML